MAKKRTKKTTKTQTDDSLATYNVCFDYVTTTSRQVKAKSVEEAVKLAYAQIPSNLEVCEIWCNEKQLPDGKAVNLKWCRGDCKEPDDEVEYLNGSWERVRP